MVRRKKVKAEIIKIYKVTLPSWVVWPGKVIVEVTYTQGAAQAFIDAYPNKWLASMMKIEEQELIAHKD